MNRHKELAKNTIILAFGKFATQLVAFLLLPIYTRFLSPSEFGVYDLTMTYMTLALPFLTLRLEYAAFRFLIDARGNEKEKINIISTMARFLAFVIGAWIILYLIVTRFVDIPYGIFVLILALAMTASGIMLQIARGVGSNKSFAIASMIAGIVTSIGSLIMVVAAKWGVEGLFVSAIAGNILATIYLVWKLRLVKYLKWKQYDKGLSVKLLRFGVPMVPSGLAWWVINGADRTIIVIFLGLAANGIYAIASKYSLILVSITTVFGMAWKESASMYINKKDRSEYFSQTINTSLKLFASLGLLMIAVTPLIFVPVFGTKYEAAMAFIPILVVGSFFWTMVELYAGIYVAKKLSGKLATTNIIAAIISVVINLMLIESIGLYAPAISMLVAFATMAIWRAFDSQKYVKITYDIKCIGKLLLTTGIVVAIYYKGNGALMSTLGLLITILMSWWVNRKDLNRIKELVVGKLKG